jgi:hypothetical protein
MGAGLFLAGAGILTGLVIESVRADLPPLPRPEWASLRALVITGLSTIFTPLFISAMSMSKAGA